ncbi:MAG: transposase [Rhodobacter sp.]|nr:transposase [Rhodobacter sp.]
MPSDRTIQEIAAKHRLHPTQVSTWKKQAVDGLSGVFSEGGKVQGPSESEIKDLHAKIGKLAVKNDFLAQGLNAVARQAMFTSPKGDEPQGA